MIALLTFTALLCPIAFGSFSSDEVETKLQELHLGITEHEQFLSTLFISTLEEESKVQKRRANSEKKDEEATRRRAMLSLLLQIYRTVKTPVCFSQDLLHTYIAAYEVS